MKGLLGKYDDDNGDVDIDDVVHDDFQNDNHNDNNDDVDDDDNDGVEDERSINLHWKQREQEHQKQIGNRENQIWLFLLVSRDRRLG